MKRLIPAVLLLGLVACWPPPKPPVPTPTPEPTVAPTPEPTAPPVSACPRPLAPGAVVYTAAKPWGQGQDATYRVRGDAAFCEAVGGAGSDCHLEGLPPAQRVACELELAGGCPVWQFTNAAYPVPQPLRQVHGDDQNGMSADHFGNPAFRDDPQTPAFEGQPAECGLQRDGRGHPMAGFFAIVHGKGQARACRPDGAECSRWIEVDH